MAGLIAVTSLQAVTYLLAEDFGEEAGRQPEWLAVRAHEPLQ